MKKISACLTAGILGIAVVAGIFESLFSPRRKEKADEKKGDEPGRNDP
jgi:hypothetical protein